MYSQGPISQQFFSSKLTNWLNTLECLIGISIFESPRWVFYEYTHTGNLPLFVTYSRHHSLLFSSFLAPFINQSKVIISPSLSILKLTKFLKNYETFEEDLLQTQVQTGDRLQVSISPTFYEQLLHQNPFAKKLQTLIVST